MRPMFLRLLSLLLLPSTVAAGDIARLYDRDAGTDMSLIHEDVAALRNLAEAHIAEVGLVQAIDDFQAAPWIREANGLHIWGVTTSGISWFDAGHPELVGLDVSQMGDLNGRIWLQLATRAAATDDAFELLFPHPNTSRAAQSAHRCFRLEGGQRILCAGAFVDVD